MKAKQKQIRLAITTGDSDGIGLEVTAKALLKLKANKSLSYTLFLSSAVHPKVKKLYTQLCKSFQKSQLEVLLREDSPAHWVEDAARGCLSHKYNGLVTGPLSKETIQGTGMTDIGHTDILKRISSKKNLHMAFVGDKFNVLLATGHIAISHVSAALDSLALIAAINAAEKFRTSLSKARRKLPLALVGLNPHAGENGIIGQEELSIFLDNLSVAKKSGTNIVGPLSPDAAFMKDNWKKYSIYICCYHDQGLIPFKMIHGQDDGVHVTLGLPFIRTSVDHGTAKDIFGKNRANPQSMLAAIKLAAEFAQGGA